MANLVHLIAPYSSPSRPPRVGKGKAARSISLQTMAGSWDLCRSGKKSGGRGRYASTGTPCSGAVSCEAQ